MNNIDVVAEAIGVSRDVFISAVRSAQQEQKGMFDPTFRTSEQEQVKLLVETRLNWDAPQSEWRWISAMQFLREVGITDPTNIASKTASFLIKKLGKSEAKRTAQARLISVPPLCTQ